MNTITTVAAFIGILTAAMATAPTSSKLSCNDLLSPTSTTTPSPPSWAESTNTAEAIHTPRLSWDGDLAFRVGDPDPGAGPLRTVSSASEDPRPRRRQQLVPNWYRYRLLVDEASDGDCPACGLGCRPGDATVEVAGRLFHQACAVGGQDTTDDGLPDAVEPPVVMGVSSQFDSAMRMSDRFRRLRRRDRRAR